MVTSVLTWVFSSVVSILVFAAFIYLVAWIVKSATAGKDWNIYVWNIAKGLIVVGFFAIPAANWLYLRLKTDITASPIINEAVSLVSGGQAALNFGLETGSTSGSIQIIPTQPGQQSAPTQPAGPVVVPTSPPICIAVSQPADVPVPKKGTWKNVGEVVAWRAERVGDQWVFNLLVLDNGTAVSASGAPSKFGSPPASISACSWIQPTPLPTSIPPTPIPPSPTPNPAVLAAQCSLKWAEWAAQLDIHHTKVDYKTGVAPIGVQCTVLSGKSNASKDNEVWKLTCKAINVVDYEINGWLGRSIQGDRDIPAGSVFDFVGSGDQCADLSE